MKERKQPPKNSKVDLAKLSLCLFQSICPIDCLWAEQTIDSSAEDCCSQLMH